MRAYTLLGVGALLLMAQAPAWGSRAVTEQERVKLVAALTAQGCSGGKMRFDDGKYEVDEAVCKDGRRYDLDFDASTFKVLKKRLEK
jgi:hypothetical protein